MNAKLTLRRVARDRTYAAISIGGLVIGFASFLIMALYLAHELSFDRHHEKHERIFRVATELQTGGQVTLRGYSSRQIGPLLKQDYAEVEEIVRFSPLPNPRQLLTAGDRAFYWDRILMADDSVFEVFTHRILYGDPATALVDPMSIAISRSMAERYFGRENPLNRTLETSTASYQVTLVFEDLPDNEYLKYDALLSFNRLSTFRPDANLARALWSINAYTYVLMQDGFRAQDFDWIQQSFYERYMQDFGARTGDSVRLLLEPLADIYLTTQALDGEQSGSMAHVIALAGVALLLLSVAAINYMNLATAGASLRAREIGMRKVLGAQRRQLVAQFLGESLLFTLLALVLSIALVQFALSYGLVEALTARTLAFELFARPGVFLIVLGAPVAVGIVAGLYPAFYLSSIGPVAALRGSSRVTQAAGGGLRLTLVFVQFAISIGVIGSAAVMASQMRHIASHSLGFEHENLVNVTLQSADVLEQLERIKATALSHPAVIGVASADNLPGDLIGRGTWEVETEQGGWESTEFFRIDVDPSFLDVMGIELVSGRNFSEASRNRGMVLVNETAVQQLGWRDPIGRRIGTGESQREVIGVVRDFNFQTLHRPIAPMLIDAFDGDLSHLDAANRLVVHRSLIVRFADGEGAAALQHLRSRWPDLAASQPFEHRFVDQVLRSVYDSERTQMRLLTVFAGVCIFLACLGLFGLSAFTTAQRTREIGVRRVLGASAAGIVLLLFKRIGVIVLLAAVLASIGAFYLMSQWLASFAHRVELGPMPFLLTTAGALLLAFMTVALQSLTVARASPSAALRSD